MLLHILSLHDNLYDLLTLLLIKYSFNFLEWESYFSLKWSSSYISSDLLYTREINFWNNIITEMCWVVVLLVWLRSKCKSILIFLKVFVFEIHPWYKDLHFVFNTPRVFVFKTYSKYLIPSLNI